MAMTLGGRAAEEIVFGEITTGASNDLEKVTADRQADGDALRHEREARPARLRPRPRPAVPRPRVLHRARLLRRDRARDRRRGPPHRRSRAPARQGHPHRAPRASSTRSPRSSSSARRSRSASSWRCSTASPRSEVFRADEEPPRPELPAPATLAGRAAGREAPRPLPRPGWRAVPPRFAATIAELARAHLTRPASPLPSGGYALMGVSTSPPTRSPTAGCIWMPAAAIEHGVETGRAKGRRSSTWAASPRGPGPSRWLPRRRCGACVPVVDGLASACRARDLDRHRQGDGRRGGAGRRVRRSSTMSPRCAATQRWPVSSRRRRGLLLDAHARRAAHDAGEPRYRDVVERGEGVPGGAAGFAIAAGIAEEQICSTPASASARPSHTTSSCCAGCRSSPRSGGRS